MFRMESFIRTLLFQKKMFESIEKILIRRLAVYIEAKKKEDVEKKLDKQKRKEYD